MTGAYVGSSKYQGACNYCKESFREGNRIVYFKEKKSTTKEQDSRPAHAAYKAYQPGILKRGVPCPAEIKATVHDFAQRFSMDKTQREQRIGHTKRLLNGKRISHIEALDLNDVADERWFKRNQEFINEIQSSRDTLC